jgi:antitoxin component YwqK of YwqJK toxin-antitoxin module
MDIKKRNLRLYVLNILIILCFAQENLAQSDTSSVYKNLETKKFYRVQTELTTNTGGVTVYKVEGKIVDKATFKKYHLDIDEFGRCCPCLAKWYNINGVLICEEVACTDCRVGSYKEFYPNGKIKVKGQYKETKGISYSEETKNDWNADTVCEITTGKWTYFSNKGDTLYHEYWKNGQFIKQVPEQNKTEIWAVDLFLDGKRIETNSLTLSADQVKNLVFKSKYKNTLKDDNGIVIEINLHDGYKPINKKFTLESFKNVDIGKLLSEDVLSRETKNFSLKVYYKESERDWFRFILYIKD